MGEISNKETNETNETKEASESSENKEMSTHDKLSSLDSEKKEQLNKELEDYRKEHPDATREETKEHFAKRIDEEYNSENDESGEDDDETQDDENQDDEVQDDDDDDVENDNELTREKVVTRAKEVDESGNLSDAERRNMREEIKGAKGLEAKNEVVKKYEGIAEENQKKREDEELER